MSRHPVDPVLWRMLSRFTNKDLRKNPVKGIPTSNNAFRPSKYSCGADTRHSESRPRHPSSTTTMSDSTSSSEHEEMPSCTFTYCVCVYGLPIFYLDLSSTLARSQIRGLRLDTIAPGPANAWNFYRALTSAFPSLSMFIEACLLTC